MTQHLSDEAIAAFADGVLRGAARERATRHTSACPECAHAVVVQREAVWALRAAPAPALPSSLLDRLREVPDTTPIAAPTTPAALGPDGSAMFAAFGSLGAAAFVPPSAPAQPLSRRVRALVSRLGSF
jgi:anti-sigma factor RsiW